MEKKTYEDLFETATHAEPELTEPYFEWLIKDKDKEIAKLKAELEMKTQEGYGLSSTLINKDEIIAGLKAELAESIPRAKVLEIIRKDRIGITYRNILEQIRNELRELLSSKGKEVKE